MDYLDYFKLTEEPFGQAPLPRFYYASEQHTSALKRMLHAAAAMKGLALLIADIGRGKTTLARRLLDALPPQQFEAAMLVMVHTGVTANWLLKRIAAQLGVSSPADDKLTLIAQLYDRLSEVNRQGRKAVVLIDEAQMLQSREIMEELRGLLNLELPGRKLLTIVLFGLPVVERYLGLDPPLAQRVALACRLGPLSEQDTANYVQHRLRLAGSTVPIFDAGALAEVHRLSRGVPRVINTLCDNILLELFFAQVRRATPDAIAWVASNLRMQHDGEVEAGLAAPPPPDDRPAVDGGPGSDAIAAVGRDETPQAPPAARPASGRPAVADGDAAGAAAIAAAADEIAARIASEPMATGGLGGAGPGFSRAAVRDADAGKVRPSAAAAQLPPPDVTEERVFTPGENGAWEEQAAPPAEWSGEAPEPSPHAMAVLAELRETVATTEPVPIEVAAAATRPTGEVPQRSASGPDTKGGVPLGSKALTGAVPLSTAGGLNPLVIGKPSVGPGLVGAAGARPAASAEPVLWPEATGGIELEMGVEPEQTLTLGNGAAAETLSAAQALGSAAAAPAAADAADVPVFGDLEPEVAPVDGVPARTSSGSTALHAVTPAAASAALQEVDAPLEPERTAPLSSAALTGEFAEPEPEIGAAAADHGEPEPDFDFGPDDVADPASDASLEVALEGEDEVESPKAALPAVAEPEPVFETDDDVAEPAVDISAEAASEDDDVAAAPTTSGRAPEKIESAEDDVATALAAAASAEADDGGASEVSIDDSVDAENDGALDASRDAADDGEAVSFAAAGEPLASPAASAPRAATGSVELDFDDLGNLTTPARREPPKASARAAAVEDAVAEALGFAGAGGPAPAKKPAPAATPSPAADGAPQAAPLDRKRFTTSSGKVIDLGEIDDLLADLE